jgi:hypothetical protein
VDWNEMDDLICEILGTENPLLTSTSWSLESGESSEKKVNMGDFSEIDVTDVAEDESGTNSSQKRQEEEMQQQDQTPEKKLEAKEPVGDEKIKTSYGQQAKDPKKEKIIQVTFTRPTNCPCQI